MTFYCLIRQEMLNFVTNCCKLLKVNQAAERAVSSTVLWEKFCEHSSSFIFDLINLILAGKEDMHKSLDEFEFQQICNRVTALD